MRKAVGYLSIFVAGGLVSWLVLRGMGFMGGPTGQAGLLGVLTGSPRSVSIPDNPIVKAVERIRPAVVNIDTAREVRRAFLDQLGNPFEQFQTKEGKGSGVIISSDGYVVTNNHVVEGASIIRVTLASGKRYDGQLVGADPSADLAIVKIEATGLPVAELGDSSTLKVGEYVITIGYPLGIGTTVTHGIVSALDRKNLVVSEGRVLKEAIQTDAPINRGNSGGALANMAGQLIGINTAIVSEGNGGNIGIGFAIPINTAKSILQGLIAKGRTLPPLPADPFIGINYQALDATLARQFGIPAGHGVVIADVKPLTAAADARLQRGDVVVEVDSQPVVSADTIRDAIKKKRAGDVLTFKLVRGDGSRDDVKLTLGHRPPGLNQQP